MTSASAEAILLQYRVKEFDMKSEEETHKSLGISLFLFQFFVHSVYRLLEKEADEVLVSCFRTNHTEGRNVFLAGFGWDDEERMIQS